MEYFNNQLCITHSELTDGIVSKSLIDWWVSNGKATRVRRACNNTPALFVVESIPYKYRTEVYKRHPDLKAQAESKPFVDSIEYDGAALNFYETYLVDEDRHLSNDKIQEYTNNASILNACKCKLELANSQRARQSQTQVNKGKFWGRIAEWLPRAADKFPNTLPQNPRRLQEKYNQYLREGYEALVTGKFGTRNAAKISDDTQESLIMKLLSDARNLDNSQIAKVYNVVADQLKWSTITSRSVGEWREKLDLETSSGRLGATRFRNQKTMQIKRSRPTMPLLYWTMDGWTAELMYQKTEVRNGKTITTYTNRLTIVLVLDTCLNYPVGYAIGERENPELIKAALRNAANHTAELFGQRYRTNQLQSDNYGRGNLTPTYEVMGDKYTPARAHNAKAKVIEPYFGTFNKKYCQYCTNWSGFGITSNKNLQPNSEYLNKNRHSFPDAEGCRQQLINFVERERAEKREQYLTLYKDLPSERKLPLTDEQYLLTFGAETGFRNAIEGTGLRPTIGGIKRDYDCFNPKFREYAHIRWSVKYDPDDLEHALAVNEDGSLRFMLEKKHVQPMALAERKEGDAQQLKRIHDFNANLEDRIIEKHIKANEVVEQLFNDNPQLDVATRLLLCDSNGQNKNNKSTRRLQAHEIEDVQAIDVATVKKATPKVEDDNLYNLY